MGDIADSLIDDNIYKYSFYSNTSRLRCSYCGVRGVFWKKLPTGKWRMHDTKTQQPHTCREYGDKHG